MVVAGSHRPVSRKALVEAVETVLTGERRWAAISISFVGPARIRRLNAQWLGHDRITDVISFGLDSPTQGRIGDVYICAAVARAQAKAAGASLREELLRLVIHGTLHVLGHDHPDGEGRTRSPMWRKQERYLACVD